MRYFSFNHKALEYDHYAVAQRFFAQKLAQKISNQKFEHIAELGCGSGILLDNLLKNNVNFQSYIGCDSSEEMLLAFKQEGIKKICIDFDAFLSNAKQSFSLVCSSSALQWSKNLDHTLGLISQKAKRVALGIIDCATFSSLHSFLQTSSPLLEFQNIKTLLLKYFCGDLEVVKMSLEFDNPQECIAHLRGSGVMGGGVLNFTQSKKLLSYQGVLEYESVIFVGKPKNKEQK